MRLDQKQFGFILPEHIKPIDYKLSFLGTKEEEEYAITDDKQFWQYENDD